jgi:hypothetical protein
MGNKAGTDHITASIDKLPDSPASLAALQVPGDPRRQSPEWIDASRKAYGAFGNVVAIVDPLGRSQEAQPMPRRATSGNWSMIRFITRSLSKNTS